MINRLKRRYLILVLSKRITRPKLLQSKILLTILEGRDYHSITISPKVLKSDRISDRIYKHKNYRTINI